MDVGFWKNIGGVVIYCNEVTSEERDIIDRESENIIRMWTEMLNDFKVECRRAKRSQQMAEFMDLVLEALSSYMNAVHHIANEQRQFRIQRKLETYKFLKFNSDKKSLSSAVPPKLQADPLMMNGLQRQDHKGTESDIKRQTTTMNWTILRSAWKLSGPGGFCRTKT
ncbi:AAEL002884-PA [Aedes aegypti]|uniref:AAEL002884-PA n=1 Tax=Aedes aegypti TaxID=7159 RepID=Q17GS4_AEDAE|nr:AAEL002884-PA [Aedes aegypti]